MRKLALALAGVAAIGIAAPASASVVITEGTTTAVPGNNNFQAELAALGLTQLTFGAGSDLTLLLNAPIMFEFLGSESAANDTFTAGSVTHTETSTFENHFLAPIVLGMDNFTAGSLANQLVFTSSLGALAEATVGDDGFGIFLPAGYQGGPLNVFYLGYDDQINNADDNHDDFIVRATVLPEPGTWAMMLFGFGAVGYSMRKARRAQAIPQIA